MKNAMKQKSEMKLFQNDNFGTIRTVILDGEPWFVAKDVCDILGTTNPTMAMDGLEPFERTKFNLGRQGEANIISESGFYTLVLRSRKPIAKPFRIWVTSEVLPAIRKTGKYIAPSKNKVESMLSDMNCNMKIVYAQINNIEEMIGEQNFMLERVVDNMTLSTRQQQQIYKAAKDRINHLLNGAHSKEYKENSKSFFINLWNNMKSKFGCGSSYKDLNPIYFEDAIKFISSWKYEEN
ncbi:BRO family protein [[Ruminococcus] torques]|uniref:BRO family protein n=1 Tax=[Ruminococcus] torques TaxID=33039 RepID=UPI00402A99F8